MEHSLAHPTSDRRVRRTRQLLRAAFLALLTEKPYEDITVQDVIERADVARSTFYAHYLDKEDLLLGPHGLFSENLSQHRAARVEAEQKSQVIVSAWAWFYHIQAQGQILKKIRHNSAMDLAMHNLHKIVRGAFQTQWQAQLAETNAHFPAVLVIDYLTSTLMTLIKWWVEQDMPYTPERMDEIFQQLVTPGLASILDGPAV